MNKLLVMLLLSGSIGLAYAGGEMKEVCHDKMDKAGKTVMKNGQAVQECKKIKVHKKLEGTDVPTDKKKK
jgi:hypothetical protein